MTFNLLNHLRSTHCFVITIILGCSTFLTPSDLGMNASPEIATVALCAIAAGSLFFLAYGCVKLRRERWAR